MRVGFSNEGSVFRLHCEARTDGPLFLFPGPQEEDFQELEDAARKMEHQFSQFFDHVMVNDGLQDSTLQLLSAVRQAQDQPHWVPTSWLRPSEES